METYQPEILHELLKLASPPGQRDDDIHKGLGRAEIFILDSYDGPKWPEQNDSLEFIVFVPLERQLIQGAFVSFGSVDACQQNEVERSVSHHLGLWLSHSHKAAEHSPQLFQPIHRDFFLQLFPNCTQNQMNPCQGLGDGQAGADLASRVYGLSSS